MQGIDDLEEDYGNSSADALEFTQVGTKHLLHGGQYDQSYENVISQTWSLRKMDQILIFVGPFTYFSANLYSVMNDRVLDLYQMLLELVMLRKAVYLLFTVAKKPGW